MISENKENLPFFYIILPTFNRPELVKRAVKSVISQKYENYQLIIFNDGSTESYIELENLIKSHSNIKYIKSHNIGINKSRNSILDTLTTSDASENSYFFTLSDDDYLTNDSLATISAEIQKYSSIWYCFNCTSNSQHLFSNIDFETYSQVSYSNFTKDYKGDKHFVFKLKKFKNIRYPAKHFKNGYEHIFYYQIPAKIYTIPKTVKIIEYYEDGLSRSDLYKNSLSFSTTLLQIKSAPLQFVFYKQLLKYIFKPKNIIKEAISKERYYRIKKALGLQGEKRNKT